ncbi:MAG: hypothetical protein CL424_05390 [Acidimicrobiaceae bacterium]|nr:hypothetical protein [Acidimicrobiaceae bacterium]
MQQRTSHRLAPLAIIAALTLAACGDDADGTATPVQADTDTTDTDTTDADTTDTGSTGVLQVEMADFHYGDLPDEVPSGTRIEVTNSSESEIHEFVAVRLADDDNRPVADIIADLEALLGSGPPTAVLLAAPGGEQIAAVGDGTLDEPGRYIIVCVIPTGADPAEYLAAAADSDGPPDVDGGAPHVMNGMYAELTVTG